MTPLLLAVALSCGANPDWGTANKGLACRLSLVTEKPQVGQPIELKLEAKGTESQPVGYDDQQCSVNDPYRVTGPDGKSVPYVGGSFQTMGQRKSLAKDQTAVVYKSVDLAQLYLVTEPGEYTITAKARGGLPESNALKIKVEPGKLTQNQKLLAALHKVTPAGWEIARYGKDSIVWHHRSPTGLKADVSSITLHFTNDRAAGKATDHDLGQTYLGVAWLRVDSGPVDRLWPDYEKTIRTVVRESVGVW